MVPPGTPERPNEWPSEQPAGRRRVLVALRGTEASHAAIEVGRVIARTLGVQLHGVLIWPTPITPAEVPRLLRIDPKALNGMVLDVDVGDPVERLDVLSRCPAVAFVVLAEEAEPGTDLPASCSTALRAVARMSASAIIVRPGTALAEIRNILVPLDGTPSTAAALEPAGELAARAGAALDLVLVEEGKPPPSEPGTMAAPRYIDQPQHEWPAFSMEFIQRFVGSVGHRLPGVPVRFFLGMGRPAAEILRYASELRPDLIALVWREEGAEPGPVIGEVLKLARQPVLVVRR